MNQRQVKFERKQLRNIVLAQLPTLLKSEAITGAAKELAELINARLDAIDSATEREVKKIDTQTQSFRGYMMRELGMQLTDELGNISVTMLAWQEVLTKRMGITDLVAFDAEVADKKVEIMGRIQKEAQEKADAEAAAQLQANKAKALSELTESVPSAVSDTDTATDVQAALGSKDDESI